MYDFTSGDEPQVSGVYVVFVEREELSKYADRIILVYTHTSKTWNYLSSAEKYRGHIYGYIGPLPTLELFDD